MVSNATRSLGPTTRLAVALIVILIALGVFWYGLSAEIFQRMWADIVDRPSGPVAFRFILQPLMAALKALHDGVADARLGRDPYLWTILTESNDRPGRLREGLTATAQIILLGFAMDAIYQAVVLKTFYPGEMTIVAILLAFIPYLLLRGPFCRMVRRWTARRSAGSAS